MKTVVFQTRISEALPKIHSGTTSTPQYAGHPREPDTFGPHGSHLPQEQDPIVRADLVVRDDIANLNPHILDTLQHWIPTLLSAGSEHYSPTPDTPVRHCTLSHSCSLRVDLSV